VGPIWVPQRVLKGIGGNFWKGKEKDFSILFKIRNFWGINFLKRKVKKGNFWVQTF